MAVTVKTTETRRR